MGLPHMTKGHFIIIIIGMLIFTVVGAADTRGLFQTTDFLQSNHEVWAQTPEIFPNSSGTAMLGNRSLVPGMHVMSLVNGVKPTWLIISSDNELSVNIRYNGIQNMTTPNVSLIATALKTASGTFQVPGTTFERITGSNITQGGWTSPITVPLRLEGSLSLYDADLIVVMIVPYTGSPLIN